MQILLAMSLLALVAVLWATISIGRHIRKSRKRTRFLRERQSRMEWSAPSALEIPMAPANPLQQSAPTAAASSFAELALTPPPVIAIPALPPPTQKITSQDPIQSAGRAVAPQTSSAYGLDLIAAARKTSNAVPQPQTRPSGILKVMEAKPSIEAFRAPRFLETPVAPPISLDAPEWPPKKLPQAAEPIAAKAPVAPSIQPNPALRRPVRSVSPQQPASPFMLPLPRTDWVYFNKDMGDLSDPLPSRMRDRARSR